MAHKPPPVRCCLFDMDGLLIDSEDKYTTCTNDILREYGKPDLPWSIKAKLQGRPAPQAQKIFQAWAQLPIDLDTFYAKTRVLQAKYFPESRPLPGVQSMMKSLCDAGVPIALATSSHSANFDLKTSHLTDLFAVFPEEHRVKGDDTRIKPGRGKPAPDIYLLALDTINNRLRRSGKSEILPRECLVFEDSVPGVESGRRAGMQVAWVPHPGLLVEYRGREKEVLAGLTGEHEEDGTVTGDIDDGWATLFTSLADFPYGKYGIVLPSHGQT